MSRNLFPKFLNRHRAQPETPFVRPSLDRSESSDSIDSNATAPNLPGPGRNIGLVYDALGAKLENVFLRTAGRRRVELNTQLVSSRFDSLDSIASDATAPNNPGPGRNVGLLFDTIGRRIERVVNNVAGRYKLGPQATLEGIRRLRRFEEDKWGSILRTSVPTPQEYRVLKKRCRKLLKYCRSHLLETQLEALEAVTALALEDPYGRQILATVLHESYLIPRYKEDELYAASSKALISVKDNEVHEFWARAKFQRTESESESRALQKQFVSYLRDPDVSFLFGRLLLVEYERDPLSASWNDIRDYYLSNVAGFPRVIEWESLREFLTSKYFGLSEVFSARDLFRLAHHFPVFQLPDIASELASPHGLKPRFQDKDAHWITQFLSELCGSRDLVVQLQFLRSQGEETRKILHGTVFASALFIAYLRVCHSCNCTTCGPFICVGDVNTEASVMLHYYHRGTRDERMLAEELISASMDSSRYFRFAVAVWEAQHSDADLKAPFFSPASSKFRLAHFVGADSYFCGRWNFYKNIAIEPAGEELGMYADDTLVGSHGGTCSNLFLWLEVFGNENPFDATGHFPMLAGYDVSGDEIYVARVGDSSTVGDSPGDLSYVSQGARSVTYSDSEGNLRTVDHFFVLVLKYDPCDVGVDEVPEGSKFQTGPAYWIREEGLEEDSASMTDSASASETDSSWDSNSETESQIGGRIEEIDEMDDGDSRSSDDDSDDGDENIMETESEERPVTEDDPAEGRISGALSAGADTRMGQDKEHNEHESSAEVQQARRLVEEHQMLTSRKRKLEERELEDLELSKAANLKHLRIE